LLQSIKKDEKQQHHRLVLQHAR